MAVAVPVVGPVATALVSVAACRLGIARVTDDDGGVLEPSESVAVAVTV